ncbi:NAD(P)/FAD-dependent oxidoreductase [Pectobacterium parmentieri]|uniref:NAD(P)/FAD-dependent oxidoreductase n=1 Tax=Pectobacterium parmentieri TaxID=1905730 RepID=UPI0001B0E136|nr:NAD(P)/FAD-dependent oxidoreductase [Pectobacterium parmentieri]ACX88545.1 FAD-dependent pyridine nucleotide-disulphide oxidoreductase [Pectobacterium parmentieri WPP163]AYH01969.1 NAD(P)/FAD-dependent oxidoreductase [Pectobacterium parmentieri]AYH28236.1 NAD(P)/FAD-dependent oxidoreductase [Pectobacterium parmentieri]AYH32541.1 NAD(P)/FAD-dependent oxidoreductase [Pectobacterium parmentieri]MBI0518220.1 NAD(P)/FAD-dependent oxidoreductase [Pectobacterium parmentieri]
MTSPTKKIVIVGGGAGGLELATSLGHKLGRKKKAEITLVDRNHSHLWKPLLHEVATGSLDDDMDALSYLAHARNHGFQFQLGMLTDIDRGQQQIQLAEVCDEQGDVLVAARRIPYDILVVALGSASNDFGTPGVKDHCIFLDNPKQARRFHNEMLNLFLKFTANQDEKERVNIAIVGGGATGVELSAELHNAVKQLHSYGFDGLDNQTLNVTLVEAGERILPALPPRISAAAHQELNNIGVRVLTKTMVTSAESGGLNTKDGEFIDADLMVWAAGIKAPDAMKDIAGLETNRINQLVVEPTLQTTRDPNIFAIGDCASCPQEGGGFVPPRAQAAHQMASRCHSNIIALLNGQALKSYVYKDHGSLVSLSKFSTVGSLMGNLMRGSVMVEGRIARFVYISLYRMHQVALHGYVKTGLMMLVGGINRVIRPRLKLH